MKKYIIFVLVLVVCIGCVFLVSADTAYSGVYNQQLGVIVCDSVPPTGHYNLSLSFYGDLGLEDQTVSVDLLNQEIEEDGYTMFVCSGEFSLLYNGESRLASVQILPNIPYDENNPDVLYNIAVIMMGDIQLPVDSFTFVAASAPSSGVDGVLQVFTDIGEWFAGAMETMTSVFWDATEQSLTVLGVLAVAGVACACVLLVFKIVLALMRFN